jgi:hypothetical protein
VGTRGIFDIRTTGDHEAVAVRDLEQKYGDNILRAHNLREEGPDVVLCVIPNLGRAYPKPPPHPTQAEWLEKERQQKIEAQAAGNKERQARRAEQERQTQILIDKIRQEKEERKRQHNTG